MLMAAVCMKKLLEECRVLWGEHMQQPSTLGLWIVPIGLANISSHQHCGYNHNARPRELLSASGDLSAVGALLGA